MISRKPIPLQPSELKGLYREEMGRETSETWVGNKLVVMEHFSSGEKWGQGVEIMAQVVNL